MVWSMVRSLFENFRTTLLFSNCSSSQLLINREAMPKQKHKMPPPLLLLIAAEPEKKVIGWLTNMEKSTEILNGHFQCKVLKDGGVDRNKVICNHCQDELPYHRSSSSLKYHLNAKHTVDASKSYNQTHSGAMLWQTTLDAGRSIDKLTNAIAKVMAADHRPDR